MPTAVKMQREFGEDLNTVFVESQGSDESRILQLALQRKWLGTRAVWTKERPVRSPGGGLPNFVLLSPDGEIVLQGNPLRMHSQIEEYVEQQRQLRRRGARDLPSAVRGIAKDLARGRIADAVEAAREEQQDDDAEVAEAASRLLERALKRAASIVRSGERLIEAGYYHEAEGFLEDAVEGLEDLPEEARVRELLERLESDELEEEVDAEKALVKIEARLFDSGGDERMAAYLARFVEKYDGTKAAARARRYVTVLGG